MQFSIFCPIFDRRTMFAPTVLSNTICEKISFLLSEQTVKKYDAFEESDYLFVVFHKQIIHLLYQNFNKTAESGLNKGMQPPVAVQNVKCGI